MHLNQLYDGFSTVVKKMSVGAVDVFGLQDRGSTDRILTNYQEICRRIRSLAFSGNERSNQGAAAKLALRIVNQYRVSGPCRLTRLWLSEKCKTIAWRSIFLLLTSMGLLRMASTMEN